MGIAVSTWDSDATQTFIEGGEEPDRQLLTKLKTLRAAEMSALALQHEVEMAKMRLTQVKFKLRDLELKCDGYEALLELLPYPHLFFRYFRSFTDPTMILEVEYPFCFPYSVSSYRILLFVAPRRHSRTRSFGFYV
jgi:hypothetical protein